MKILVSLFLVLFVCGCSPFEIRENLTGMSISDMKRLDNEIFSQKIKSENIDVAYDDIVIFLKSNGATFLKQDKKKYFIVSDNLNKFYSFCINTTKVAIHLTQEEKGIVNIDIASRNHDLGKHVSAEIFGMIGPKIETQKPKVEQKINPEQKTQTKKENSKIEKQDNQIRNKKQEIKVKKQESEVKNNWEPKNRGEK